MGIYGGFPCVFSLFALNPGWHRTGKENDFKGDQGAAAGHVVGEPGVHPS